MRFSLFPNTFVVMLQKACHISPIGRFWSSHLPGHLHSLRRWSDLPLMQGDKIRSVNIMLILLFLSLLHNVISLESWELHTHAEREGNSRHKRFLYSTD